MYGALRSALSTTLIHFVWGFLSYILFSLFSISFLFAWRRAPVGDSDGRPGVWERPYRMHVLSEPSDVA